MGAKPTWRELVAEGIVVGKLRERFKAGLSGIGEAIQ